MNDAFWRKGETVGYYSALRIRPVEAALLEMDAQAVRGRVLELGCGTGRLTAHLCEKAASVHAIDLSPAMASACRARCPRADVRTGDMRDLGAFADESFDAIFAVHNVLDVLADDERGVVLDALHRVLSPSGMLVFSSHNRGFRPGARVALGLLLGDPRQGLSSLLRLPVRIRNRRRLAGFEHAESRYALVNDAAHDFAVVHYYIGRDAQEAQLRDHGFRLERCLDLGGQPVPAGVEASRCPELVYVARR